jgi:hypothetical protein
MDRKAAASCRGSWLIRSTSSEKVVARLRNSLSRGALHAAVLEGASALQRGGDVAGDEQDARTIRPGRNGSGQDVAGTRTADAQADAEPAADPGVAIGHETGPLLVRRHDRPQPGPLAQFSHQGVDVAAWHQEDVAQSLVAQAPQKELRTSHEKLLLGGRTDKGFCPSTCYTARPNRGGSARPGD